MDGVVTKTDEQQRRSEPATRVLQPENHLENLCAQLIENLADEITRRVIEGLDARDRERDRAGGSQLEQLLSLDELVAALPPSKKPATWKRWLYERSRHGHIPGCVKLGGALHFRAETVHEWLQAGAPAEWPERTGCLPPTEQQSGHVSRRTDQARERR